MSLGHSQPLNRFDEMECGSEKKGGEADLVAEQRAGHGIGFEEISMIGKDD